MGRLTKLLWLVLLGGGCVATTYEEASPYRTVDRSMPAHASLDAVQTYPRLEYDPLLEVVPARKDRAYTVFRVRMPSVGHNRQRDDLVTGEYFQSNAPGRRPLVVVLPIWGASTYPPRTLQRRLTRGPIRGRVNVLIIDGANNLFDWETLGAVGSPADFDKLVRDGVATTWTTLADLRRLLDWAGRRPEVNDRMAIVGFSRGAIVGSVLMGIEPRLDTGVFAMAGADLHEVVATCPGRLGKMQRHARIKFGWSHEDLVRRLEAPMASLNPARWAGTIDPRQVLFVEATKDECVPEAARERLWTAMGQPERIRIHAGHQTAFLSMTLLDFHSITRRIQGFLEERLLAPAPAGPSLAAPVAVTSGTQE